MPTLFHQTFEARAQLAVERAFGVTVTLRRGSLTTDSFTATFDVQEYDSVEFETGLNIKVISRDFYLPASSIVFGGSTVEPTAGMVIHEGDAEYEICPIAGRPAAELQPGGYRYLVHTKEIKAA